MATALATLRSKLNTELKIDKNDKIWSQTAKDQYLNQAYFQVQKDGNYFWRENQGQNTFNSVSGTQEYALPSDFIRLDYIAFDNNNLYKTTLQDIKTFHATTQSSTPNQYYIYGSNIGLQPIPLSAGSVYMLYRKRLPTLTAIQDDLLPEDFDDAIVKYAAYLAWSSPRGNEAVAASKRQDYELVMNTLRAGYQLQDSADLNWAMQRRSLNYQANPNILYY